MRRNVWLLVVLLAAAFPPLRAQSLDRPPVVYHLQAEANFQEGCFAPCRCPIARWPLDGQFLLEPAGSDGLFRFFDVTGVDWTARGEGVEFRINGSGTYRVGGEFAAQHELSLDLQVGDRPVEHYDSGLVGGGSEFPTMDTVISVGDRFCYDRAIEVRARPALRLSVGHESPSWPALPYGTGVDVAYGDLETPRSTGGDFAVTWLRIADDIDDPKPECDADRLSFRALWLALR